ncbi:hypothetical protein MKX08_010206 [Trichoderma sp. CBMAI-0020]|nr:hypothetical protein MKX08_010206 [Trichoderma sp. CBMAI-0020]
MSHVISHRKKCDMDFGITGNTATSGAKQSNTWIQFTLFKQNIKTATNAAAPTSAAIGASLISLSTGSNSNLWTRAYELVQRREGKLMEDYLNYLDSLLTDIPSPKTDILDPQYVKCIVNQLFNLRENGGIHVQFPRGNTAAQEEMEKLAKFLLWSDSIIKTTVDIEPHAALAWSGVSLFFYALAKFPVYIKAMLEGFNTLSNMQIFWKACEETYLSSSNSQIYHTLQGPLEELYSFIIEYQARIICHVTKLPVSRISKWVTGSDNWTEMIQQIQSLDKNCLVYITEGKEIESHRNRKAQLEAIQKQVTLQEELLQDIKNNKEDDMERKLLRDLSSVSGDYARYKNINPARVPGTCEWFLADDRFCQWRDSPAGALLWASAGSGCGKSVLSRCLIDEGHLTSNAKITIESSVIRASQEPVVVCYFFFKEGGEGRMDDAHALCALLHQLFLHPLTSNLITHALPIHKGHAESLTQRMNVLWQILVKCAESSSADIICVLDALDECRRDSAQRLPSTIKESYSQHNQLLWPSRLKFLITSRPYDDINGLFDTLQSVAIYMHFNGDEKSPQIGEEINLVIDAKVRDIAEAFSDEARDKISKRLKSMENRTYLWLHLTFDIIEKNRSNYSRRADIEKLLDELPSQVADAYEKILSKGQNEKKVEALLQIVLAATRPLTLDEVNNALVLALEEGERLAYATLKENLWARNSFEITVRNLCGLFISIHDSKLSFIHQTAREFLVSQEQTGTWKWKGRLNLSKSHGTLSRACLNYLQMLDYNCQNPEEEYPFLNYAARNWVLHFRLQDAESTKTLRKPAREFCRISSSQARFWVKEYGRIWGLENLADLHLAAKLGLAAVVYDVIVHEDADVNKLEDYTYYFGYDVTPLLLALFGGHLEVVEFLLDPALGAKVDEDSIRAAAGHRSNAEAMMTLLLDKRDMDIKITEWILERAAANRQCGAAVLTLLLNRRGHEIRITQSVVEMAAKYGSTETLSLLLDKRGNEFEITEAVLINTMKSGSPDSLDLLLDHSNDIKITEKMVQAAANNQYGPQILQLLLERRGHEVTATEDIFKAAADNKHGPEAISLLLDKYGNELSITEDIFKAAVANWSDRTLETVSLLLDKRGHEFKITGDIVKAAVTGGQCADEVLSLLLDKRGREFKITEDIVKSAAANRRKAKKLMLLLLNKRGHEFKITEDIVRAAVANERYAKDLMLLLRNKRGHEFTITEDIVQAAAANNGANTFQKEDEDVGTVTTNTRQNQKEGEQTH